MREDPTADSLESLSLAVGQMLFRRGFVDRQSVLPEVLDAQEGPKPGQLMWIRRNAWRKDAVYLTYRPPDSQGPGWVSISKLVAVRVPDGRELILDVKGVGHPPGSSSRFELPTNELEGFVRDRVAEVERHLDWFDAYETPASALERLQDLSRNGIGRGTQAHDDVTRYLSRLGGGE